MPNNLIPASLFGGINTREEGARLPSIKTALTRSAERGGSRGNQLLTGLFDPEGSGFDMQTARARGMKPAGPEAGENEGHFGSVVPTTREEQEKCNMPEDSFLIVKGKNHPTFDLAVGAERERGFTIKKCGGRYYSVPARSLETPEAL